MRCAFGKNCYPVRLRETVRGKPMVRRFEYELVADYYQFYPQDEGATGDLSNSWTQEAVARLLAVAPGTIGVGTVRNMRVPVVVEVSDTEPDEDVNAWDQVNECSLDVLSGRMVVAGCTDSTFPMRHESRCLE